MEETISLLIERTIFKTRIAVTCIAVVSACAVLHNLSRYFRDILPEEPELDAVMENDEALHYEPHWQPDRWSYY